MMRLREAVEPNHSLKSIPRADECLEIPRQRGRIARDIGNRRYFRFDLAAPRAYTNIRARRQGGAAAPRDPDIVLYRNGQVVAEATDDSTLTASTQTLEVNNLAAGTYVIEVYDSGNVYPDDPDDETGNVLLRVRISP